ncbi:ZF-HD homeobox protein, Cys/His-rich dimerization domain-containing protein [Artemisia annua]|uniref:ZF-HD homeobox protein, Cys/His-rich dimerization domain-containing protein n=1 Tax=Artemisia annua TaxID=35608 RepID=A0A2U1QA39_ARTAN|nr:ZF-HD homeobox protein, Cys/His-rich dimerization domain-containing protein [Artemisia annua]
MPQKPCSRHRWPRSGRLRTAADPPGTPVAVKVHGRKRFRTKFSQEQKEKMQNFAEKVGWKMQRCDDKMVTDFCNDIGIKRRIFKVWMHNNKNTFAKKDTTGAAVNSTVNSDVGAGLVRSEEHLQDSTNGSSSSS